MARSNAAEKRSTPEGAESQVERPDMGAQEAPEAQAEGMSRGEVFELRLPGGGKMELHGAGKVEIAGLDQQATYAKGEEGPVAIVMPELEMPAREKAADAMDRMLDVYDEALKSVAEVKGLDGAERDAWLASMSDRKIDMVAAAMGEESPEAALVTALKAESGVNDKERQDLADLGTKHRDAKMTAEAAYAAVKKNESAANIKAYNDAVAEVYGVEAQMTELHKSMDPTATAEAIAERVQGMVGIETSNKSLGDMEAEVASLQEQMDALSSEASAERMGRIKEIETQMRDIDAGKGGKTAEANYAKLNAERQELMSTEDEPTVKWSVLEAARNKLAAVLPWMKDTARLKEIEARMREIDERKGGSEAQAEYKLLEEEKAELEEIRSGMEAAGVAPREAVKDFDPRTTALYKKFRGMYQSLGLKKRAESMMNMFGRMAEVGPSDLAKKAFEALSKDIETGKVEYSELIETNEEGEATVIGGEPVLGEIPEENIESLDEEFFIEESPANSAEMAAAAAEVGMEASDFAKMKLVYETVKGVIKAEGQQMDTYGLPNSWTTFVAQKKSSESGFFKRMFGGKSEMKKGMKALEEAYMQKVAGSVAVPERMKQRLQEQREKIQKSGISVKMAGNL